MVDPLLEGKSPMKGIYQAIVTSSMFLGLEAYISPLLKDVIALEYLATVQGNNKPMTTIIQVKSMFKGNPCNKTCMIPFM